MAPFNKRQIGYIKAVAGVGQHSSFITFNNRDDIASIAAAYDASKADESKWWYQPATNLYNVPKTGNVGGTKALGAAVFSLDNVPLTIDHTDSTDINAADFKRLKFEKQFGPVHPMGLLTQYNQAEGDEAKTPGTENRVGEDFYLESTHLRWRFTMPDFTVASGKQPHHEYRWIVFRQRKPTLAPDQEHQQGDYQWLNWNYDLFNGYAGRPVGPAGWRKREKLDGTDVYVANARGSSVSLANATDKIGYPTTKLTADDFMTLPINEADYVVMRDERFFLGAEHGKSHYETVTRFDWSDAGSTSDHRLTVGLDNEKNYRWFFLIIGTTNDTVSSSLNIDVRGTTALTSA